MDIIDFPNKAQTYYRKALTELQVGNVERAIELFEQSLAIEMNIDILMEFINACVIFQKVDCLTDIWAKYYPNEADILQIEAVTQLYIISLDYILPVKRRLITFNRLQAMMKEKQYDTSKVDQLITYYQQLNLLKLTLEDVLDQHAIASWAAEFVSMPMFQQLSRLKQMYVLDVLLILPFIQEILVIPAIANFIKSDILHYLLNQEHKGVIQLSWFGQQPVDVKIDDLQRYTDIPFVNETRNKIIAYCTKTDPHLEEALLEQLMLQAMIFYPFYQKTGLSSESWYQSLINPEATLENHYLMQARNEVLLLMFGEEDEY